MRTTLSYLVMGILLQNLLIEPQSYAISWGFPPGSCSESSSISDPHFLAYKSSIDSDYRGYLQRLREKQFTRKDCHKTWTVLIYMVATPDLMKYALADIQEMESQAQEDLFRSDVVLQLETPEDQRSRRYHIFSQEESQGSKSQLKILNRTLKEIQSPLISESVLQSDPQRTQRFREFLKWAIEEYPSEYYLVVMWGHGQGWTSIQSGVSFGGLGRSQSSGNLLEQSDYLDIPSIRKALNEVSAWRGRPIEVFASDACLMESVEDATELAGSADYICGSEDIESYAGFPYGTILSHLNSGSFHRGCHQKKERHFSHEEPYWVASMIPELYKQSFDQKTGSQSHLDPGASYYLTSCTVSSKAILSSLVPALNRLGSHLKNLLQQQPELKSSLRYLIQHNPSYEGGTQDLGIFLKNLAEWMMDQETNQESSSPVNFSELKLQIKKTCQALRYSVVHQALGEDYHRYTPTLGCEPMGLSIWMPPTPLDYESRKSDFTQSLFYQSGCGNVESPGWKSWMEELYSEKSMISDSRSTSS